MRKTVPVQSKPKIEKPGLNEDQIQEIREAFNLFNTSGTGKINPKDLIDAMDSLGFKNKNATIFNIFAKLQNQGKEMDFDTFFNSLISKLGDKDTRAGINKIFDLYDDDKTGFINLNNMKRVSAELNEKMSPSELEEMLHRAGSNGKEINRQDFYNIMTRKPV